MRNKRWQLEFTTLKGNRAVISIYKEGYDGTAFDILEPAAVPFETEEDNGEDILEPVRGQTGYLRVIDKAGTAEQLVPEDNRQHYLELEINEEVKWCGYIQAAIYTESWESCPREVSFSVASGLAVLESEDMDQAGGFDLVNFAGFIVEAINSSGINYERLYMPEEFKRDALGHYSYPLLCSVSRYNFFTRTDALNENDPDWKEYAGKTYREMLSEWCKLWGWSLRERGKHLYLVSVNTDSYRYFSLSELQSMASGYTVDGLQYTAQAVDMADLALDGADNTRDIIPGKRKIMIQADINPVEVVMPELDWNRMQFVWYDEWESYTEVIARAAYFYPEQENVKAYLYRFNGQNYYEYLGLPMAEDQLNSPAGKWFLSYAGAYILREDSWKESETAGKTNYNYQDVVRIVRNVTKNLSGTDQVNTLPEWVPVLTLKSDGVVSYDSGCLNMMAKFAQWHTATWNLAKKGQGDAHARFKFRFGDRWWTGSTWSVYESTFSVDFKDWGKDTSEGWHEMVTNKTLSDPYNGAEQLIMPIRFPMSGEIELTVCAGYCSDYLMNLAMKDLSLKYMPVDWTLGINNEEKEIKYYALTGGSKGEHDVKLSIHTENGNGAAYSNLIYREVIVRNMHSVIYGEKRPEECLLGTLKRLMSRNTERLSIQFEHEDLTPCVMLVRNGKQYYNISEKVNWCDDSALYILEDVPQIENA